MVHGDGVKISSTRNRRSPPAPFEDEAGWRAEAALVAHDTRRCRDLVGRERVERVRHGLWQGGTTTR
jgi:hypothetical protein